MQPTLTELLQALELHSESYDWKLLKTFSERFYHRFPFADAPERSVTDFAACILDVWAKFERCKSRPTVHVFNPNVDDHGWSCGRTVIVVQQKDMPFLVDSIRIQLNQQSLPVHVIKSTVVTVKRDANQHLEALESGDPEDAKEALVYVEVGLIASDIEQSRLKLNIETALGQLTRVVDDYPYMLDRIRDLTEGLQYCHDKNKDEYVNLLNWLMDSHFTFLGIREFEFEGEGGLRALAEQPEQRLGVFHSLDGRESILEADFNEGMKAFYKSDRLVAFAKSSKISNIHRAIYSDYLIVKKYNADGKLVGEARILGFYTYAVYSLSAFDIPVIRQKMQEVVERSGFPPGSHDGKNIRRIIETYPRDELFHADTDTLFETIMGVAEINERDVVRLFLRKDPFGKFVNTIIYIPRDIYNTAIREKFELMIAKQFQTNAYNSTTYFSESNLARTHTVFCLQPESRERINLVDVDALEASVVDMTRGWLDHFESALVQEKGELSGLAYFRKFKEAFSAAYRDHFDARMAIDDIKLIESLKEPGDIAMDFFKPANAERGELRFKVLRLHAPIELSNIIPLLENMGLRVLGEHPYKIHFSVEEGREQLAWLHDFSLKIDRENHADLKNAAQLFKDAFSAVWHGQANSDKFNHLILAANLTWLEVSMLRAYAGYMKQTAFNFSQYYIAETLVNHTDVTQNLVALFKLIFDPSLNVQNAKSESQIEKIREKILTALDGVKNLNEDVILRRYLELINATLRTNYFMKYATSTTPEYIAFKFSPRDIPDLPEPRPMYEIYVYSPRMEGVHLRGGKVARGGLRWSDRLQDFRTEILGLVKAQQVKNAVIVPSGAKGGFIVKKMPYQATREEQLREGIACYRIFIQGLLDITDNYVGSDIVPPANVICRDEPDPYLVVAADKGTATFSDIANKISLENEHWLGDAFASGGSQGYDHKAMGITAKGAWVSVQRHFREMGHNTQTQDFTVVGIGDMAGDVFGNGMLLSEHICLVVAFNHMHIFVDPKPNAAISYEERKRLFELPRSTWADYNTELISKGGGIFSRSQKYIPISEEMKEVLAISDDSLTPNALISAALKAPVDLIWNGGIGTYIKASDEQHSDVGDKANDVLRVNGGDLRARVFGEGGNLGLSQRGRIEFALNGGACNTDFIDNAAGVDCSDHEVNIKILLDDLMATKELNQQDRNTLLADMTETVSKMVLKNNYRQTLSLTVAQAQASQRMSEYRRFISYLESEGKLDRELENLPDDETLVERYAQGGSLTRPELSVLICYAKVMLKEALADSEIAEDEYVVKAAEIAFPYQLVEHFKPNIYKHRLLKEIVATQVANDLINNLGITAVSRLVDSTGASVEDVSKAYIVSRDVFKFEEFLGLIESLDYKISADAQTKLMSNMIRRVRRGTRWFIRNLRDGLDLSRDINVFREGFAQVIQTMESALTGNARAYWEEQCEYYRELGIPESWIAILALPKNLYSGLGIIYATQSLPCDIERTTQVFYELYERLGLGWLATQLSDARVDNVWQALARETFLDDLEAQLRKLVVAIIRLHEDDANTSLEELLERWLGGRSPLAVRWFSTLSEMQGGHGSDFAMLSVALKELADLSEAIDRCTLKN